MMVERLEDRGLLRTCGDAASLAELEEALDGVEILQAWLEARLAVSLDAA